VDQHRAEINKNYPDFKTFKANFVVSDAIVEEFVAAGEADEIKRDEEGLNTSGAFIRRQLKALIANQVWGTSEYYQTINDHNPIVKEALNQMKSDNFKKLKLKF
jgi:carboxyl-terminal processing protease